MAPFSVIVVAVGASVLAAVLNNDAESPAAPTNTASIGGTSWSFPDDRILEFDADGTFRDVDAGGELDDSDLYATEDGLVTFTTETGLDCQGISGQYQMTFPVAGERRSMSCGTRASSG